ncbi:MAG: site-specific integrase [Solidesulfovibrio sp.]|uniref:tyrosine-type recombinase/integrase n=1 Tax=Solidesulfovibrio sp. TaxID=2910990 RepID=UPI0031595876
MPAICKRRGEMRWRAQVKVDRAVVASKWFGPGPKGGTEYRKAITWEEETKARLATTPTVTESLTLLDLANHYLDFAQERHTAKTYKEKAKAFKELLKTLPPETALEAISVPAALRHLRSQAKKRSGNAANKDRKNLATAWNWGRKYLAGFPGGNPFLQVDKYPETRHPRYVPPVADFDKVMAQVKGQDYVMLTAFLHLAARKSEIFRMTWDDVDFPGSRIRLWTRKRRGGNLEADWVPMTGDLKAALLQWWEARPIKDTPYVFVCLDATPFCEGYYGKPFDKRNQFMRRMCDRAGVPRFGFHAIRHLTATILFHAGQSVSVIQRILRHKHPSTTERYLRDLGLDAAREALEAGLGSRGPAKVLRLDNINNKEVAK